MIIKRDFELEAKLKIWLNDRGWNLIWFDATFLDDHYVFHEIKIKPQTKKDNAHERV